MLNNFTIKAKIQSGVSVLVLGLLAYSAFLYQSLGEANQNTDELGSFIKQQAENATSLGMVRNIMQRDQLQKDFLLNAQAATKSQFAELSSQFDSLVKQSQATSDTDFSQLSSLNSRYSQQAQQQIFPQVEARNSKLSQVNNEVGPALEKMAADFTEIAIRDIDEDLVGLSARLTHKLTAARAYFNLYMSTHNQTLFERASLELDGAQFQIGGLQELAEYYPELAIQTLDDNSQRMRQLFAELNQLQQQLYRNNQQATQLAEQINDNLVEQINGQWQTLDGNATALSANMKRIGQSSLWTIVLVIVGSALLMWFIGHLISTDLKQLLMRTSDIADGDGDLTQRVDLKGKDEPAQLAGALNAFISRMQGIIEQSQHTANSVESLAQDNAGLAERSKQALDSQRDQTRLIAVALEQLSASAREVASNAHSSRDIVGEANSAVGEGLQSVDSATRSVNALHQEISSAHQVISKLAEETEAIGGVVDVIKSMTEQTNLLALNAAIEAARAGDAGRGFAVVADEVRSLANRTQTSASEIEQIITRLQNESKRAVTTINSSYSHAEENRELAELTQQSFISIQQSIAQLREVISAVSSSADEQYKVTDDISEKVNLVYDLSEQSLEISDDSARASQQSASQAVQLNQLLGQFKV